jgi:hypothetical protein
LIAERVLKCRRQCARFDALALVRAADRRPGRAQQRITGPRDQQRDQGQAGGVERM